MDFLHYLETTFSGTKFAGERKKKETNYYAHSSKAKQNKRDLSCTGFSHFTDDPCGLFGINTHQLLSADTAVMMSALLIFIHLHIGHAFQMDLKKHHYSKGKRQEALQRNCCAQVLTPNHMILVGYPLTAGQQN